MSLHPTLITRTAFDGALARYPALIQTVSNTKAASANKNKNRHAPKGDDESLAQLDAWRLEVLPGIVRARMEDKTREEGPVEKDDLVRLLRWKLKHGTFRPKLLALVQSNDTETVARASSRAATLLGENEAPQAMRELASLKGVGPATASLILSALHPKDAIFFSDEAFRWLTAPSHGAARGSPWDAKIKYTMDEYRVLVDACTRLRTRLIVGASEVERVAWVLGHDRAELGAGQQSGGAKEQTTTGEDTKEQPAEHGDAVRRSRITNGSDGSPSKEHAQMLGTERKSSGIEAAPRYNGSDNEPGPGAADAAAAVRPNDTKAADISLAKAISGGKKRKSEVPAPEDPLARSPSAKRATRSSRRA